MNCRTGDAQGSWAPLFVPGFLQMLSGQKALSFSFVEYHLHIICVRHVYLMCVYAYMFIYTYHICKCMYMQYYSYDSCCYY